VEQEAAEELIDWQSHDPLAVAVRGIPPSENDLAISYGKQAVVGDGDAVNRNAPRRWITVFGLYFNLLNNIA